MKRTPIIIEGRRPSSSPISRRSPLRSVLLAAVAAIVVLCSNLALADNTGYTENNVGKDQSVVFKDDPLAAGGWSPNDTPIRVMPSPKRVLLLRPRTQFVTEMLKSVEAL